MYSLIVAMELRLQTILQQATYHSQNIKENAIASIMECDEVKYHWNMLSVSWELEVRQKGTFPIITELWVTMRGFAYASAWVEQPKH